MSQSVIDVAPEVLDDLVAANRILSDQGILDAFGHVSIRHPGNPDHCNLFPFHELYSPPDEVQVVDVECRTAARGCVDCKKHLIGNLNAALEPFRQRRAELTARPTDVVRDVLHAGRGSGQAHQRLHLELGDGDARGEVEPVRDTGMDLPEDTDPLVPDHHRAGPPGVERLADRYGARRVFVNAIKVYLVGSLCCGLSNSVGALVASRILQGVGGAMMTPVARLIVVASTPRERLVQAMNAFTIPARPVRWLLSSSTIRIFRSRSMRKRDLTLV